MGNQDMLRRFCKLAPFAVMTRAISGWFISEELDQVFDKHRQTQYCKHLKFSAAATAVADVALCVSENFNQAYLAHRKKLGVAVTSYYEKLNGIEPPVSEAVVARSGEEAMRLQDALGFRPRKILPGYRLFGVDGNVLAKTEKRQGVLRDSAAAPLPGKIVARFDLQRQVFDHAFLLEDAHDQESATCDRLVESLQPNDVLIADRHYCIVAFLVKIAMASGMFVIRQHGRLKGVLLGKRKLLGIVASGTVYEQSMKLSAEDDAMVVRRITILLNVPTRDGDKEIHILTNLPDTVDGRNIAEVYRLRWDEEKAFHVLQMTLTCELASVSHPRAALFLFCMAMLAFNMRQVVLAALSAEHDDAAVAEVSHYHMSSEISRYTDGMLIALDDDDWRELLPSTRKGLATLLRQIARDVDLRQYKKSHRGPKKQKPFRSRNKKHSHVSTAKLLKSG